MIYTEVTDSFNTNEDIYKRDIFIMAKEFRLIEIHETTSTT